MNTIQNIAYNIGAIKSNLLEAKKWNKIAIETDLIDDRNKIEYNIRQAEAIIELLENNIQKLINNK